MPAATPSVEPVPPVTDRPDADSKRVLILGATGYVGGRLGPELVKAGHRVRCLARKPEKLDDRPWRADIDVVEGDLLEPDTLPPAFANIDVVYYLVHSLGVGEGFEEMERRCAKNAARAAAEAGVEQIIYLGGLGDADDDLSPHLRSRHVVGEVLGEGPTPVTEIRAAIILGSGSASFEMLRGLTEILPVMVTPRWVRDTSCQPTAVRDVLAGLLGVVGREDAEGVWEIGGSDIVTYQEMMQAYARVAGLRKRLIVPVPVLTPRLSSRWVDYVTTLPATLATELVESLQNDVVVRHRRLRSIVPIDVLGLEEALELALAAVQDLEVPTRWTSDTSLSDAALPRPWDPDWAGGTVLEDTREVFVDADPGRVLAEVKALGGADGWLGYDALWRIRAIGDAIVGGVGGRRGRRHPTELGVGDMVDMFRVDAVTPEMVRLRAEMKMPGYGWLEWSVRPTGDGATTLTQSARFVPKGVWGRLYWLMLVPFHQLIFGRLLSQLAGRAESKKVKETAE